MYCKLILNTHKPHFSVILKEKLDRFKMQVGDLSEVMLGKEAEGLLVLVISALVHN